MFKFHVTRRSLETIEEDILVSGTIGDYEVEFELDECWDGWTPQAVFTNTWSKVTKEQIVEDNKCIIPWETLTPGTLLIGIYGMKDNNIRPTIYSKKFCINEGVEHGDLSKEATPEIYQQIVNYVSHATIAGATIDENYNLIVRTASGHTYNAGEVPQFTYEDMTESHKLDLISHFPQKDWEQEDETSLDYIKNKPSIYRGKGEQSLQVHSGDAFGDYSVSLGLDSISGFRGCYFKAIDFKNKKIFLTSVHQHPVKLEDGYNEDDYIESDYPTPAYEIGDEFSILMYFDYHFSGVKIASISGNVVTYEGELPFNQITIREDSLSRPYRYCFCVPDKPTIGTHSMTTSSFSEGRETKALGRFSHTEGYNTISAGNYGHAEGNSTKAGPSAHSEGQGTKAIGHQSHSEGLDTTALAANSHAEGLRTLASGTSAHAEGEGTVASGLDSHSEGNITVASEYCSHAEGYGTEASAKYSHAEGNKTIASGEASHSEGILTKATGHFSHAEGWSSTASGKTSHAEGRETNAIGVNSHAEGYQTSSVGDNSHSEGFGSISEGRSSHSEGHKTKSIGIAAHSEGRESIARGDYSHAESYSVAEGAYAHSEGYDTTAVGVASHAEGYKTSAIGERSHAEGYGTISTSTAQHVQGRWNEIDDTKAHILGNGTDDSHRSNAHTIDWSGNAWFAGDVTVGEAHEKLLTESEIDIKLASLVDSAPETLDTLNELAKALGDDPNFATTIANQLGNKVDKVSGKGLSTNDFTDSLEQKLTSGVIEYIGYQVDESLQDYRDRGFYIYLDSNDGRVKILLVAKQEVTYEFSPTNYTIYHHPQYRLDIANKTLEKRIGKHRLPGMHYDTGEIALPEGIGGGTGVITPSNPTESWEWGDFEICGYISDANFTDALKNKLLQLPNSGDISKVATSGSYDDLSDKLIVHGSGENSFKSINAHEAISDYSVALGNGTVVGCRGYYIKSIDTKSKKIYLTNTQTQPVFSTADNTDLDFETPDYTVGNEFITVNHFHYWIEGTVIKSINHNVIEYDDTKSRKGVGYTSFSTMAESEIDPHDFSFFVPMQSTIGTSVLKPGGFGAGYNVHVMSKYGFGAGYGSIVFGNYGTALGRVCRAGGSAVAAGQDCWALGNQSIALGHGLRATADTQSVFGRYNRIDSNLHYMIGNGTSDTSRSNCHEMTKWGTAWYADKVLVGGANIHDPNAKVLATQDYVKEQIQSNLDIGKWALTSYIDGITAGLKISTSYPIEYVYVWRVWVDDKDISGEIQPNESFTTSPLVFEDTSKIKLTIEIEGNEVLALKLNTLFKHSSLTIGNLIIL